MKIAIDPGAGAIKIVTPEDWCQIPSIVAMGNGGHVSDLAGLNAGPTPETVHVYGGEFAIGLHAHAWGRPIENLDADRFAGSVELEALLCYALDTMQVPDAITALVGLPLDVLTGPEAEENVAEVKHWLLGKHAYRRNGTERTVSINGVRIAAQPVGALMDFLLDENGHYISENRTHAKGEIGILSIGMNTVELLAVDNLRIVQRLTAGRASGVRRLLELCNPNELYSRGEMDARLRTGALDYSAQLPIWASEISDAIDKRWGNAWKRFNLVIVTGGGANLLMEPLTRKFAGRVWFPGDPVMSTARGLYKFGLRR
jgi:hypothetical protein